MSAKTTNGQTSPDFAKLATSVVNNWQAVNNHLINYAQASLQSNLNAAQEIRQVQSPQDLLDFQMRLVRRNYESAVDEAKQIGALLSQLQSDAIQAISPQK